ncbi:MAG: hypothetical protein A2W27_04545 [Deltaproteobacteria bacterium RBG_16_44_11]|nr:MAG: hypothetical protein A2W27_04545 [Deltaproteobacteria bacterium RBG_16_44_11]
MQILSIIAQILMAIATIIIAVYAYHSFKLSSAIKHSSETNQSNINKLYMGFITTFLYVAKYSHTSQKDVKIQDFDYKYKEVEKYFESNNQITS